MTTVHWTTWRRTTAAALAAAAGWALALAPAGVLSAHTAASAIAVAAGSDATVTFRPEHGCGDSPTVAVRIQAPVGDARAGTVEGWTATATPDGAGNTVLEWTGGSVPADEAGAFPVELVVPDAVGSLLAFPAVQACASGEELAWIGTVPGDEYPAPQVLVLPAGAEPAATLDEVPADAPGRDLLVALAAGAAPDDDAGEAAPPTTVAPTTPPAAAPTTAATTAPAPPTTAAAATTTSTVAPEAADSTVASPTTTEAGGGDDGGSSGWVVAVIGVVVVAAIAAVVVARRRAA